MSKHTTTTTTIHIIPWCFHQKTLVAVTSHEQWTHLIPRSWFLSVTTLVYKESEVQGSSAPWLNPELVSAKYTMNLELLVPESKEVLIMIGVTCQKDIETSRTEWPTASRAACPSFLVTTGIHTSPVTLYLWEGHTAVVGNTKRM